MPPAIAASSARDVAVEPVASAPLAGVPVVRARPLAGDLTTVVVPPLAEKAPAVVALPLANDAPTVFVPEQAPRPSALPRGYIPALDSVRGIAIAAVMVYHALRELPYTGRLEQAFERVIGAGWIGVDLFFVLSGFLITGILLDAKGGHAFFRSFYVRRALRIFPLYLVVVALVVASPLWRAITTSASTASPSSWWYWTYTVNVLIATSGWASVIPHTGHLWSLSVEEQFYMIWPAVVFLLRRRTLIRVCIGLTIATAILRVWIVATSGPSAGVYVLLPTRLDALTIGALLAAVAREGVEWARMQRLVLPLSAGAAVTLLATFRLDALDHDGRWTQILAFPALGALGAAAVISAAGATSGTWAGWLWNRASLQFLGKYSYGLYAWHPFMIALVRERLWPTATLPLVASSHVPANVLQAALALGLSVAVAVVSWRIVEQPFLSLKRFVSYR